MAENGRQLPHLRQALVDETGGPIARGKMKAAFKPGSAESFSWLQTGFLRLARRGGALRPWSGERLANGFMAAGTRVGGPALSLPAALRETLKEAFRSGVTAPVVLTWQGVHRALWFRDTATGKMVELSLTRWQMAIREDDGDLAVQIAAEDDVGGLAVTADFILDAITRVACFGALVETLIQPFVYRETPAFCTTLDGLLLENAMLGMVDRAYGVGREGWVSVGESRWDPVLVITPVVLPGGRNDLGFVSSFENHIWPRLWVHGLSMAAIAGYLSYGWSFHQVWSGRPGVKLEEREYKYGVSELAEALTLDGNLSKAGLSLTFTVETKVGSHWRPKGGPLVRDCLLPWELLILRFPEFTSHLPHFRKQGEAGAS